MIINDIEILILVCLYDIIVIKKARPLYYGIEKGYEAYGSRVRKNEKANPAKGV